jgi:predicted dehydrogenase
MLKVGIIGLGVGMQHFHTYANNSECEVVAVCDFDLNRLAEIEQINPSIIRTQDAQLILNNNSINLVSIASWDNFHSEQIIQGLDNNKHLFVEKPLCLSANEAQSIIEAHKKRPHIKIGTNLILRLAPRFVEAKKMIDSSVLGDLIFIEGDYNYGRLEKILHGWRGEQPNYSGVLGGGIHIIDLFLWLTKKRVLEVTAYGTNVATRNSNFKNFDLVTALLKFEDNLIGKFSVNLGCVYPHFHRFSIYGTRATFENSIPGANLYTNYDQKNINLADLFKVTSMDLPYPGVNKGDYLTMFIESVLKQKEPPISIVDIYNSLAVCFAIEKSAHSSKAERVSYFI